MNRRGFLSVVPVAAALAFLGPVTAQMPSLSHVRRKRLGPDEREVVFADIGQAKASGPLQLRSKGNALWVESVTWQELDGTNHSVFIRKNLPTGKSMALPQMIRARKITIAVTCLPLASTTTLVELVG